jgi:hypothetical protein
VRGTPQKRLREGKTKNKRKGRTYDRSNQKRVDSETEEKQKQ